MPRRIRSSALETRTARLKLQQRRKPYWVSIAAPGVSVGYRRNMSAGVWNVRAADGRGGSWIKSFAIADDHEDANGSTVLTFWEAIDRAKALARGSDADAGRPATLDEALKDYAADLALRRAGAANATVPRKHLTAALLAMPVAMLTARELRTWRNGLTKVLKPASANRMAKNVKAALNLAASHDDRIVNVRAWKSGLALIPEPDDNESNLVLSDTQRRALVAAAHAISAEFGLWLETHAVTGARSSQLALLDVSDLHAGKEPKLMVPTSLKGRNRVTRTRKPVPISAGLAKRLTQAAAGRDAGEPLLRMKDGRRWNCGRHRILFHKAAETAGLPAHATMYCLRHSAITRALLAGAPVRLVASSFDTSIPMIERAYSKHIADHGDAQMRQAMFDADVDAPAADNVVQMMR
jgi:Phage integrase family